MAGCPHWIGDQSGRTVRVGHEDIDPPPERLRSDVVPHHPQIDNLVHVQCVAPAGVAAVHPRVEPGAPRVEGGVVAAHAATPGAAQRVAALLVVPDRERVVKAEVLGHLHEVVGPPEGVVVVAEAADDDLALERAFREDGVERAGQREVRVREGLGLMAREVRGLVEGATVTWEDVFDWADVVPAARHAFPARAAAAMNGGEGGMGM